MEAIKSLGEKKGSLSKPIKDHIVEIYKDSVDEKKLPTTYQVNKALAKAVEDNLVVQNKQRFQLSAKEASKEDANAKKQKNAKPVQANLKRKADTDKQTDEPKSKVPKKIPGQPVLPKTKGKEIAKERGPIKGDNRKGQHQLTSITIVSKVNPSM